MPLSPDQRRPFNAHTEDRDAPTVSRTVSLGLSWLRSRRSSRRFLRNLNKRSARCDWSWVCWCLTGKAGCSAAKKLAVSIRAFHEFHELRLSWQIPNSLPWKSGCPMSDLWENRFGFDCTSRSDWGFCKVSGSEVRSHSDYARCANTTIR